MKFHDNILAKVKAYEKKKNINYAKPDGGLYTKLKGLYWLAFIFTVGVNVIIILGDSWFESINVEKNSFITIITLTALLVVSMFIMRFKKYLRAHLVSFVLNVFSCVGLALTFSRILVDDVGELTSRFYYCHLIPLGIMALITIALTFIAARAYLKTRKTYKKIVENAYSAYGKASENNSLTEKEWDEILKKI